MSRRLCIVIQSSKAELSSPPFNTYIIARKVSSAIRIKKLGLFVSTRLFSVGFPLVFITWHQLQAMSRGTREGANNSRAAVRTTAKGFFDSSISFPKYLLVDLHTAATRGMEWQAKKQTSGVLRTRLSNYLCRCGQTILLIIAELRPQKFASRRAYIA